MQPMITPTDLALDATRAGVEQALLDFDRVLSHPECAPADLPIDVAGRLREAYVGLLALEDSLDAYLPLAAA